MGVHSRAIHTVAQARVKQFNPKIDNMPDLPVIDYGLVGQSAPVVQTTPCNYLPKADAIVITWAGAEWAAMEHVFCAGSQQMPYSERNAGTWSGWQKYDYDMPAGGPSDWTYWGYTRLVNIGGRDVLLFKSNTHLDWPGQSYLSELIQRLIDDVKPTLILSIGTAGGSQPADHVGTVRVVSAGTLYVDGEQPGQWTTYENEWQASWGIVQNAEFATLLMPIPTTKVGLASIGSQFNATYGTSYTLEQLNAGGLDMAEDLPAIYDQSGGIDPLLTTFTFVVGDTSGNYKAYACIEMDDAVIGQVCNNAGVSFGFIRNVSDPAQNAALPAKVQIDWGSAIYDCYGLYTSYNGALAAWAILASQYSGIVAEG